ncbi:universal stress protein [Puerhibacterium sp. TATVAM-FAB25]|uniref:universal stress protein n=1 Tax=Puerhibacterium sp. TATVAM-FAB25 TaxID=3093699 RepID=UPI00397D77A6
MHQDGPVVVALDGSPHSGGTLDWGLEEAERREAEVLLVRAYQEPREYAPQWSWYPTTEEIHFDTEAKEYLADQLERATAEHPDLRITTQVLHGPVVPMVRGVTERARLLVIGARGHYSERGVGRTAAHLAAHARCPVAVVRGPVDGRPVVVGVDGSEASLAAATLAADEAAARSVPLVVLHARPTVLPPYAPLGVLPPLATASKSDPTHQAARRVVTELMEHHPNLEVRLELLDDGPVHALAEASKDAGLVVVGARGIGAFRGMLMGSVSAELVREAHGTVLVTHGAAAE